MVTNLIAVITVIMVLVGYSWLFDKIHTSVEKAERERVRRSIWEKESKWERLGEGFIVLSAPFMIFLTVGICCLLKAEVAGVIFACLFGLMMMWALGSTFKRI